MITGPEAGLTRDAIAADFDWKGKKVRLYDTAGLRRKARITRVPKRWPSATRCGPSASPRWWCFCSTPRCRSKSRTSPSPISSSAKGAALSSR